MLGLWRAWLLTCQAEWRLSENSEQFSKFIPFPSRDRTTWCASLLFYYLTMFIHHFGLEPKRVWGIKWHEEHVGICQPPMKQFSLNFVKILKNHFIGGWHIPTCSSCHFMPESLLILIKKLFFQYQKGISRWN